MKKFIRFEFILFIFLNIPLASAQELTLLTVEEPPSSFMNEQGEVEGFSVDIVREIQKRTNNRDPITIFPEVRALKMGSRHPNIVLFSFSRTPERERQFHWIMLLLRKPWVMYSKKDAGFLIRDLEDAKKLERIGVVRGDVRETYLRQSGFSNLVVVSDHEKNVRMLLNNRIQTLFYEPQGVSILSQKLGIPVSDFEEVLKTKPSEVYIMMSIQTPWETVEKWREAAHRIKEDGTFQHIAEKWALIFKQHGISCVLKDGALNF